MWLDGGLEHEQGEGTVGVGFYLFAFGVDRRGHILNKGHYVAEEFHHTAYAHVLEGAYAEYGED